MQREFSALGLVLLVAGLSKAADPGLAGVVLIRYGLVRPSLLSFILPGLSLAEMLVGLALLSGRTPARALFVCELSTYALSLLTAGLIYQGAQVHWCGFGLCSFCLSPLHSLFSLLAGLLLSWQRSRCRDSSGYSRVFRSRWCQKRGPRLP